MKVKDYWNVKNSYKTKREMADYFEIGTADSWELDETKLPFIDSKVRSLVMLLNSKGVKTYYSCQGHKRESLPQSYVVYDYHPCVNQAFRKAGFDVIERTAVFAYGREIYGVSMAEFLHHNYDINKVKEKWNKAEELIKECFK